MQRCYSHTCCTSPRIPYCFYAAAAVAAAVLLLVQSVAAAAVVAGGLPDDYCVKCFAGGSMFAQAVLQLLATAVYLALRLQVRTW
jgi:hypothetical protein